MAITAPTTLAATSPNPDRISLSWTNIGTYSYIQVQRSLTGSGGWGVIGGTLSGSATSYSDTTCQDGTKYYYRIEVTNESEESAYSNTANATTGLPAPSGLSGSATDTTVTLTWTENAQNETAIVIFKNGSLAYTIAANSTSYVVTGLTAGVTYTFYVKAYSSATGTAIWSSASNTETIVTADPPAAPSDLTATATGTTKVRLNWQDNADNEIDYKVERSSTSASAGFSVIATVSANVETYEDTGRTSNTQYWFRVRARNASGYSAYASVATAVTWAAIAAPTNLVVVAVSGTVVDLYFQDNSESEDYHCVEMKIGAGAYSEIVQLEPNRNAYRKTGLTAGTLYTFKVRALQGASTYSSYCAEVAVTTLDVPAAPTGLAVTEYQDTWVRLGWTLSATATGYKIQTSATDAWGGEEVTVATIPDDISSFKVTGLTASTLTYFRVIPYNGAGDGTATASVSQTTRAAYLRSAFERIVRLDSPRLIYLIEGNPLMELQGWALASGKTYTYETAFNERGAAIDGVEENGVALTVRTSVADVESNAGSWYHDTAAGLAYVHPSGSNEPTNYLYTGSFWVRFTTGRNVDLDGHPYLPVVAAGDGIPDISQEISLYFDGSFTISSGSVSAINGKIRGTHFFDSRFARYIWINRKMRILAGGERFTYSQFETVNTGIITSAACSDRRMVFNLRDYRDGLHRTLPIDRYSLDTFATMDENAVDRVRPYWYGVATNTAPVCIDTTNRIFELHAGRIKSVENVYQNGTALSAGTDYFIDYQQGRIILARGMTYSADDIITADFTGAVTAADEVIQTGAHIFKDMLNKFLLVLDADLDLDSIWATHVALTTALCLGLWKEADSQELIRRLERSIQADSFQDAEGRLGLKARLTSAPSDVTYIPNAYVMDDFEMESNRDSLYSGVNVWYGEDQSKDQYSLYQASAPSIIYRYKVNKPLDVYTALTSAADAATLASNIIALLDKRPIRLTVTRALFKAMPGDVFYLTRNRYYNATGTVANKLMRILSIGKTPSGNRTSLTVEEV